MTDNDNAEINVIEKAYPDAKHLLCWWHIIENWKKKLLAVVNKPLIDPNEFWDKLFNLLMNPYSQDKFQAIYDDVSAV